jgi:hypothetical protein
MRVGHVTKYVMGCDTKDAEVAVGKGWLRNAVFVQNLSHMNIYNNGFTIVRMYAHSRTNQNVGRVLKL